MTSVPTVTSAATATESLAEPSLIRHGNAAAKSAYAEGMGFANVLMEQLSTQLTDSITQSDSDGSDGSDDSSDGGSSTSAAGGYSSLLSEALTQGVSGSGATSALAMQLAEGIDPALALHLHS